MADWKTHKARCRPVVVREASHGAGLALWSSRPLRVGERILAESPLLLTHVATSESGAKAARTMLQLHMTALTEEDRNKVLQFGDSHRAPDAPPTLLGLALTNQLPIAAAAPSATSSADSNLQRGAIFEYLCRAQHSCTPNSEYSWNQSLGQGVLHALRPIPAGTEITISYLSAVSQMSFEQRQQVMAEGFRFQCACETCEGQRGTSEAALGLRAASDQRRLRAHDLLAALMSPEMSAEPDRAQAVVASLESTLAAEGYPPPCSVLGRAYFRLFQIEITRSALLDLAAKHIARSVEIYTACKGADSDVVKTYAPLVAAPQSHVDFACMDPVKPEAEAAAAASSSSSSSKSSKQKKKGGNETKPQQQQQQQQPQATSNASK